MLHVAVKTDEKKVVRMLTIGVYGVIHFLCVVDFCSHISEDLVKEYLTKNTCTYRLIFQSYYSVHSVRQNMYM